MPDPLRLKDMTPARAREVLTAMPRLLIPAGTLEPRGPHLPLGVDTVILEALTDDLSARTGIARTPPFPYGARGRGDEPTTPGAAALTRKTLHRMLNELIAMWEEVAAVRDITILTAHAVDPHLEALSTIRTACRVRVIDIFGLRDLDPLRSTRTGPWHGGEVDTSMLLHVAPELVDRSRIPHTANASAARGQLFYDAILRGLEERLALPAAPGLDPTP
ncbi:MAG: creatininase family protein [Gemmatimonadales bacterium]